MENDKSYNAPKLSDLITTVVQLGCWVELGGVKWIILKFKRFLKDAQNDGMKTERFATENRTVE